MEPIAEAIELESSVFFANGELWSRLRRMTSPAFSKKCVTDMSFVLWKEVRRFIERLRQQCIDEKDKSVVIEAKEDMVAFIAGVISVIAFGSELPPIAKEYCGSADLHQDLLSTKNLATVRSMMPLPTMLWNLSPYYFRYEVPAKKSICRMKKVCQEIITSFEGKHCNSSSAVAVAVADETARDMKSMLETLVMLRHAEGGNLNRVSDLELIENVMVFFIAGTDTTSMAISWTLYFLLTTSPHIVSHIREEADNFFAQLAVIESQNANNHHANGIVSQFIHSNLGKMTYCNAAFKESIRIAAPASSLFMQSALSVPSELSNGVKVNPSDMLLLDLDCILQDPAVFVDAVEYRPERWINSAPEQLKPMDRAFSLAFGAGPRQCPGMSLVMDLEGPLVVAAMVHWFDFQLGCPKEEIQRVAGFVTEINKLPLIISPRKDC
eukprot:gene24129-32546_t